MPADQAFKITEQAVTGAVKTAETTLKRAWSILDAATEKQSPSEFLSPQAIQAIQGVRKDGA